MKRLALAPVALAFVLMTGSATGDVVPSTSTHHDFAARTAAPSVAALAPDGKSGVADGQSFADGARALANKAAKLCFFAAWPTAHYKSWSLQDVSADKNGGGQITFRVFGTSRWTEKEIWVDVIFTVSRQFKVTRARWGEYHAFLPPGSVVKVLDEMSK